MRPSILLLLATACRGTAVGDEASDTDTDTDTDTDMDTDTDSDSDSDSDSDTDTDADGCDRVCGALAAPDPGAGLQSFSPPGCSGGTFVLGWSVALLTDAAKSVPVVADFDGDGDPDIAINPRKWSTGAVFEGWGNGSFSDAAHLLPRGGLFAGGWGIDVGDIDGDGDYDILAGDHVCGGIAWTHTAGFDFALAQAGLPTPTLSGGGLGDLNGDGHLDAILGADQFSAGVAVRHGDGTGGWTTPAVSGLPGLGSGSPSNAGSILFADLDGDGDRDVLVVGQAGSGETVARVFANDGDGATFVWQADLGNGGADGIGSPVQGSVGDVDCDGDIDISVGGTVYANDWPAWTRVARVSGAKIGELGDLDGDGDLDLVTHEPVGLRAWRNGGIGTFSAWDLGLPGANHVPRHLLDIQDLTPLSSPYGIDIADVDGDGDLDVVRTFTSSEPGTFSTTTHASLEVWLRD